MGKINSEKKEYLRNYIIQKAQNGLEYILEKDPFVERLTIPIKFRDTKNNLPLYFKWHQKQMPNMIRLKEIIITTINLSKVYCINDKSLGILCIDLIIKSSTNRKGELDLIDITNPK